MGLDELKQFALLEERVGSLISMVSSLKQERVNLKERVQGQEKNIDLLTNEIEMLKADRDLVRKKIETLVERIEEFY